MFPPNPPYKSSGPLLPAVRPAPPTILGLLLAPPEIEILLPFLEIRPPVIIVSLVAPVPALSATAVAVVPTYIEPPTPMPPFTICNAPVKVENARLLLVIKMLPLACVNVLWYSGALAPVLIKNRPKLPGPINEVEPAAV